MSPSVEPGWEDGWYLWTHPKQNPVWHLGCWVRGWLLWTLSRPVTPGTQGVGTGHSVEQGKHMLLMAFTMHQIRDPFFVDSSRNAPMWKKYKAKRNQNYHEIRGWGVKNNSFPLTVKKGPGLVNQNVHYYESWKILGTICLWLSTSFIFLIRVWSRGGWISTGNIYFHLPTSTSLPWSVSHQAQGGCWEGQEPLGAFGKCLSLSSPPHLQWESNPEPVRTYEVQHLLFLLQTREEERRQNQNDFLPQGRWNRNDYS